MPFAATWMDLEIIILSEVSQTEKDKYHIVMWNLKKKKKDTNELISRKRLTDTENKLMVTKEERGVGNKLEGWD